MITLTSDEENLRAHLITMAKSAAHHDLNATPLALLRAEVTMAYGEMARQLDPDGDLGWNDEGHYRGLTHALFHVNTYELDHQRPMIGAFAVSKGRLHTSGGGFAEMARAANMDAPGDEDLDGQVEFWREQLTASAEYWSTEHEGSGLSDAQFDAIMGELATIKQMVRALRHR